MGITCCRDDNTTVGDNSLLIKKAIEEGSVKALTVDDLPYLTKSEYGLSITHLSKDVNWEQVAVSYFDSSNVFSTIGGGVNTNTISSTAIPAPLNASTRTHQEWLKAQSTVAVTPFWLQHSKAGRIQEGLHQFAINHPMFLDIACPNPVKLGKCLMIRLLAKAFPLAMVPIQTEKKRLTKKGDPATDGDIVVNQLIRIPDPVHQKSILDGFQQVFQWTSFWGVREELLASLFIIEQRCTPDEIMATLFQFCDKAWRCKNAKQSAVILMMELASAAASVPPPKKTEGNENSRREESGSPSAAVDGDVLSPEAERARARKQLMTIVESYMDDHKQKALESAVLEPAKFYFAMKGEHKSVNFVNGSGNQWYMTVLLHILGAEDETKQQTKWKFPNRVAVEKDARERGVVPTWVDVPELAAAMSETSKPENFGRAYTAIPSLSRQVPKSIPEVPPTEGDASVSNSIIPSKLDTDPEYRARWQPMVENFVHFFSREFFIRKCFETLSAETKPEHIGFRESCLKLFPAYLEHEAKLRQEEEERNACIRSSVYGSPLAVHAEADCSASSSSFGTPSHRALSEGCESAGQCGGGNLHNTPGTVSLASTNQCSPASHQAFTTEELSDDDEGAVPFPSTNLLVVPEGNNEDSSSTTTRGAGVSILAPLSLPKESCSDKSQSTKTLMTSQDAAAVDNSDEYSFNGSITNISNNNPVAPRLEEEHEEEMDEKVEEEELSLEERFYAFCYRDEYYTEMNLENVESFFQWLGIVRPSEVQIIVA